MNTITAKLMNFLRSLESECADCLRRQYCDRCYIRTAKTILADIRNSRKPTENNPIDNSLPSRIRVIMECLKNANKPLLSKEIYIPNCSKGLKEWTLNTLLSQHRILRRRRKDSSFYEYFLPTKRMKYNGKK